MQESTNGGAFIAFQTDESKIREPDHFFSVSFDNKEGLLEAINGGADGIETITNALLGRIVQYGISIDEAMHDTNWTPKGVSMQDGLSLEEHDCEASERLNHFIRQARDCMMLFNAFYEGNLDGVIMDHDNGEILFKFHVDVKKPFMASVEKEKGNIAMINYKTAMREFCSYNIAVFVDPNMDFKKLLDGIKMRPERQAHVAALNLIRSIAGASYTAYSSSDYAHFAMMLAAMLYPGRARVKVTSLETEVINGCEPEDFTVDYMFFGQRDGKRVAIVGKESVVGGYTSF